MGATDNKHGYLITVYTKFGNGNIVEELIWTGLPWHTRTRFDWYFKYRAALLQVKYPKYYVKSKWWTETGYFIPEDVVLTRKIKRRTSKLIQWNESIKRFKQSWNELWSYEDNPDYIKAVAKIKMLTDEIAMLEHELKLIADGKQITERTGN